MSAQSPTTAILSRTIYLSLVVAAIGFVVFGWQPLQWYGMAGTVVFLGLEVRRIPLFQTLMAAVLVSVGIIVGVVSAGADPVDIVLRGIGKAQIFLVLFFAIQWLQTPATVSPALHAVRRTVVSPAAGTPISLFGCQWPSSWLRLERGGAGVALDHSRTPEGFFAATAHGVGADAELRGCVHLVAVLYRRRGHPHCASGTQMDRRRYGRLANGVYRDWRLLALRPDALPATGVGCRAALDRDLGGAARLEPGLRFWNLDYLGYWHGGVERPGPSRGARFCRPTFWDDMDGVDPVAYGAAPTECLVVGPARLRSCPRDCVARPWPSPPQVSSVSGLLPGSL